jgi:Xaa-Pro aminopeptidase
MALEGLLAAARSRLKPADLPALLAGVSAAPEGLDRRLDNLGGSQVGPGESPSAPLPGGAPGGHGKASIADRLQALRAELARRGLAGFIVPRADEHQGEYVPPRAERLAWITGFGGSAGLAVILAGKAAIFVDGRYTIQVRQQVDEKLYAYRHLIEEPADAWIAENLSKGGKLGYDPWLHTPDQIEPLKRAAAKAGGELVALSDNPLDAAWQDQPPAPIAPVRPHDLAYTGRDSAVKRQDIATRLTSMPADAVVLTGPDSIAWLLNLRGADVPRTPLALSFAILHADGRVDLFIEPRKLVPGIESHLGNAVAVHAPDALGGALDALGKAKAKVLADQQRAPGSSTGLRCRRKSSAAPIPAPCPRPARTRWRSRAPAQPICATAPPSPASSAGFPKRRRRASSPSWTPPRSWRSSAGPTT